MTRPPSTTDVRMKGFASRSTVDEALAWIDHASSVLPPIRVTLQDAAGRVLAQDVQSEVDVPGFDRAMMDGFALLSVDTLGASTYNPLALNIVGEVFPGRPFEGTVAAGQAVRIMTGAPMPAGADAVLPVERTQSSGNALSVLGEVAQQKNVGQTGEDIQVGQVVLRRGRRLRPADVGVLSSIGVSEVSVVSQPRVRIILTGNELLPAGSKPQGFQIVDSNGPMLTALVQRDGGTVVNNQIVPDDRASILEAMNDDVDVVLVSGGSSVGLEDHAPQLLAENGKLAIHGVAMRPSSPSGMGQLDHRLVFLLPGNPVSCLCSYDFFAGRALRILSGRETDWPYRRRRLPLRRKLVSQIGRVDYARVAIIDDQVEPLAVSGASMLTSTTRADAFVVIPADSEGFPAESEIELFLYDE